LRISADQPFGDPFAKMLRQRVESARWRVRVASTRELLEERYRAREHRAVLRGRHRRHRVNGLDDGVRLLRLMNGIGRRDRRVQLCRARGRKIGHAIVGDAVQGVDLARMGLPEREEKAHFGALLLSPFGEVVGIQEGMKGRRHGSDGGEVAVVWAAARACGARA